MSTTPLNQVLNVPNSLITEELNGLYGSNVLHDMTEIINLYDVYENGASYPIEATKDYKPADIRYKKASSLINKEVRFLFSKTPDFYVDPILTDNKAENERNKASTNVYKRLIDAVLKKNNFPLALLKAAKDCFVGKRVCLMFNINEDTGIQVSFLPSLEFIYDVDPKDANIITKVVAFFSLNDNKAKDKQRIYKKKYWLESGFTHYHEAMYDGFGHLIEVVAEDVVTKFTFIPAWIIINEGLTGDLLGTSEIEDLAAAESWYSRLAAGDMDAERKGMNPIRYTIDASPESTKGLSIAAGAFWDLSSDQNQAQDKSAQVGVLDSPMSYSAALNTTLNRIKNDMHEQVAVPNVSPEAMQGVVSSGKTLNAIYWDLVVRCDEKMLAWQPALQFICTCIIEGSKLYPKAAQKYIDEPLPDCPYEIRVENQYSLPEDEEAEKQVDLAEVAAQTMSRKSYMKKWRQLTDDEADDELRQIAMERELLEDSYAANPPGGNTSPTGEEEPEEPDEGMDTKGDDQTMNDTMSED